MPEHAITPSVTNQRQLVLELVKTIDRESRVLYVDQHRSHWAFQRAADGCFVLLSCTDTGEPVAKAAPTSIHASLDYVPAGDSATAVSFRAWRAKVDPSNH